MRTALLTIILFWLCGIYPAQSQDFSAGFSIHEIPDSIWQKMQGKTYQPNDVIGRNDLRYLKLMHWDYDGKTHHGEMVCSLLNYTVSTTLSNGYVWLMNMMPTQNGR